MARYQQQQFASISTSSSGDTTLVAAPGAGKKIVLRGYVLVAAGAVSVKFKSAATDKTGAMALAANGGIASPLHPEMGHLECAANEALILNLSGAVAVGGHLSYSVETA